MNKVDISLIQYEYLETPVKYISRQVWEYAFQKDYFNIEMQDDDRWVDGDEIKRMLTDIIDRVPRISAKHLRKSVFLGREVWLKLTDEGWIVLFPKEVFSDNERVRR